MSTKHLAVFCIYENPHICWLPARSLRKDAIGLSIKQHLFGLLKPTEEG
jgi:hypothetical protein